MSDPQIPPEVPEDQAWFWTPEWQAGERRAFAEIAAGGLTVYDSAEELIAELESMGDEIPEAAKDAAVSALAAVMADKRAGQIEYTAVTVAMAAAPVIVAAELRRLAVEMCLTDGVRLLKRANELDPQRVTR